ncbi:MAG TPA: hypothetical protein VK507_05905 [Iamia sp.]|nr:hypothetical protein [Iamia sp.]
MSSALDRKRLLVERVEEVLGWKIARDGLDWRLPDGRRLIVLYSRSQHDGRDFFVGLPNRLVAADAVILLLGSAPVVFESARWLLAYAPYMSHSNDGRPNPRFRLTSEGLVLSVAAAGTQMSVDDRVGDYLRLRRATGPSVVKLSALGERFSPEDEGTFARRRDVVPAADLDALDRASQSHARTVNGLATYLESLGAAVFKSAPGKVRFDLLWTLSGSLYVAEVKSVTELNEEQQLRLGLGQLLRYRHSLAESGNVARGVLVAERQPRDAGWLRLCHSLEVTLTWPGVYAVLDRRAQYFGRTGVNTLPDVRGSLPAPTEDRG